MNKQITTDKPQPELLQVNELCVHYANRTVVDSVSLDIAPGKITALLGPNGAGKSELVLAMAGVIPTHSGTVKLGDQLLTGSKPEAVRVLGVSAVPEGHHVLTQLCVHDNLLAAGSMLSNERLDEALHSSYALFPELEPLQKQRAGSLSGGQQQMVSLAQALISAPKFLLIDEMSLGLAPVIIERLMQVTQQLRSKGIGILLIEQFTHLALSVSDYAYVLSRGTIQFDGKPATLTANPEILHTAYLG